MGVPSSSLRDILFYPAKEEVRQTRFSPGCRLKAWLLRLSVPATAGVLASVLLLLPPNLAAQAAEADQSTSNTIETATVRTADRNFWLWTGISVGLTIADIELTQHCIHKGRCREGNPLLSGSRPQAYAIGMGITAGFSYLGYRLKKRQQQGKNSFLPWWYPQFALSAGHGVGVAVGLRFAW